MISCESGIDLTSHDERCQVVAAESIDQWSSIRPRYKRTIQTHKDRSHTVAGKTTIPIRDRDRTFRRQIVHATPLIGSDRAEVKSSFTRQQQWRIGRQQQLAQRVRKTVVKPTRHAVPQRTQVFRVSATKVLRCADILRWSKGREEVIVAGTEEWSIAIDRRFADYSRFVNVVVLERIVGYSVGNRVAVVMTVGAACTPLRDFRREDLLTARDLCRLRLTRKLGERIWEQPSLVLRPEDLQISHVVGTDLERLSA